MPQACPGDSFIVFGVAAKPDGPRPSRIEADPPHATVAMLVRIQISIERGRRRRRSGGKSSMRHDEGGDRTHVANLRLRALFESSNRICASIAISGQLLDLAHVGGTLSTPVVNRNPLWVGDRSFG
jgi:hypothetical protein